MSCFSQYMLYISILRILSLLLHHLELQQLESEVARLKEQVEALRNAMLRNQNGEKMEWTSENVDIRYHFLRNA